MDRATFRKIAGLPPASGKDWEKSSSASPKAVLTTERVSALAGYGLNEESMTLHFGLKNEDHVKTACLDIAKAGIAVDMEYFMDTFYFNFKDKKNYDKAVSIVMKKLDVSHEEEFNPPEKE